MRKVLFVLLWCAVSVHAFGQGRTGPFTLNTATGTGIHACATINVASGVSSTVAMSVGPTTFSGTLTAQTIIAGQAATTVAVYPYGSNTSAGSTITSNGSYSSPVAGVDQFQLCMTSYASGTATVYLNVSTGIASNMLGGGGGGGSPAFSAITSGTNTTAAMVVGSGASLSTTGTGTITATNGSSNQVEGQIPTPSGASAFLNFSTPFEVFVSAYCQSTTTCNPGGGIADESQAIRAIVTAYGCAATNNISCNIIDDMTGTQTWSEEPLPNSFTGRLDFKTNGVAHQVRLDGMSTWTIPTGVQVHGMGGSSSDLIGENTTVAAGNPLTDNVSNGGFQIQNTSATTIGLSASGSLTTVTLTAGAPFSVSSTAVNQLVAGRKICLAGATGTIWNHCFTIASVTSSTAPQVFVLNTDSTTQTGTCAAPCTAAVAYLNTPVISIGTGGGGGAYATRLGDVIIDGHLMIGSSCLVDGQGEEGSGTDGAINCYNVPESGIDVEQSGIYGGNGTTGTTNVGPFNSLTVNFNPYPVTLVGGANCSNPGGASTCNGSNKVPVGSGITCGSGTALTFGVLTPNPCSNANWVGVQITGLVGTNGGGPFLRITTSCADKSATATACIFSPVGASQPTGVVVMGIHTSFGDVHTEFAQNGLDFCGDSATNYTLYATYGSTITSGVNWFAGGLIAFVQGSGIGVDIGTSGNGATCNDINILGANIGAKSGTLLKDNITSCTITGSSTEQVETYLLGHGSPQGRWPSSPQCSPIWGSMTLGTTSPASTPSGVLNVTTGFQIGGAAASKAILCGNATDFVSCLSGVPVDATNPATLLSTDRANYLNWTSGTALALPAVSGNFASNFPFVIKNTSTTLTITPNAGASDLIDGSATGTVIPNFASFVYQDSTSAPGHWFTIKYPTFAAFGSTCATALTWSTTTGFGCGAGGSGAPATVTLLSKTATYAGASGDYSSGSAPPTLVEFTLSAVGQTYTLLSSAPALVSGNMPCVVVKNVTAPYILAVLTGGSTTLDGIAFASVGFPIGAGGSMRICSDGTNYHSEKGLGELQSFTSNKGGYLAPFGMGNAAAAGVSSTANTPQCSIYEQPFTQLITNITYDYVTGVAASTGDWGIYDTSGNLLTHTGSQVTTTVGGNIVKVAASPAIILPRGTYVACACASSLTVSFQGIGGIGSTVAQSWGTTTASQTTNVTAVGGATSCTAGVLPASTTITTSSSPNLAVGMYLTP